MLASISETAFEYVFPLSKTSRVAIYSKSLVMRSANYIHTNIIIKYKNFNIKVIKNIVQL